MESFIFVKIVVVLRFPTVRFLKFLDVYLAYIFPHIRRLQPDFRWLLKQTLQDEQLCQAFTEAFDPEFLGKKECPPDMLAILRRFFFHRILSLALWGYLKTLPKLKNPYSFIRDQLKAVTKIPEKQKPTPSPKVNNRFANMGRESYRFLFFCTVSQKFKLHSQNQFGNLYLHVFLAGLFRQAQLQRLLFPRLLYAS